MQGIYKVLTYFSLRRDRFAKSSQDTKKTVDTNDKSNLYKSPSQNLSSSLSRVDCGRYSLRTSRAPQPNSVRKSLYIFNIVQNYKYFVVLF